MYLSLRLFVCRAKGFAQAIKIQLRHLHVTDKDLSKIISPIEDITDLLK
jgi:hypothetical protein